MTTGKSVEHCRPLYVAGLRRSTRLIPYKQRWNSFVFFLSQVMNNLKENDKTVNNSPVIPICL